MTPEESAVAFVHDEAGFAQVTTIDRGGYPVARSMTAFLAGDWSVHLVQRASHARIAQWRRNPRTLVTWVGEPSAVIRNDAPHVFDLGTLPDRLVSIRGDAEFMPAEWTREVFRAQSDAHRASGNTRAPLRSDDDVDENLLGVRIRPFRVRLEGFGADPTPTTWTID